MGSGLIESIEAATLCSNPWPHLEFTSFLPDELAQGIVAHWPSSRWQWLKHSDAVQSNGTSLRRFQPLSQAFPEIADQVLSAETQRAFTTRLGVEQPLFPVAILVEDAPGYWIRRHTDCAGKVISTQCYFAERPGSEARGVVLEGNDAKQIPYSFNSGYAFRVTRGSWHRVRRSDGVRRSLQIIYYDRENPAL